VALEVIFSNNLVTDHARGLIKKSQDVCFWIPSF